MSDMIAELRRACRMTSVPTNPVAPVTMSFILMMIQLFSTVFVKLISRL